MPFTFIEVEERKTRVISAVFAFIMFFYFLTVYLVFFILSNAFLTSSPAADFPGGRGIVWPSGPQVLVVLALAFFGALFHWLLSVNDLINKMSLSVGALPCEPDDTYHNVLKNIVDEVSVAIGGRKIEPLVIQTPALNAFALEDFQGRAVIGVTEGLLTRLNRSQLEAVVGHEAGHLINGDCLSTTVTCSLAEIYDEAISKLSVGLKNSRGRAGALMVLLFLAIGVMRFFSMLVRYFISREKEFRADATSVRLTRDPLSLAEALALIARNWRGSGSPGERLESIFIMNPNYNELDDASGVFADMFSTHPPIKDRIKILTDMAHMDVAAMEEHLKNKPWVSPVAKAEVAVSPQPSLDKKWFVFEGQKWGGPYRLDELKNLAGLSPDQWIRLDGAETVRHAYEDADVMKIFTREAAAAGQSVAGEAPCPHCYTPLSEIKYEGAPAMKCFYCDGIFVDNGRMGRILYRTDMVFSEEVVKRAELIIKQRDFFVNGGQRFKLTNPWVLTCPKCRNKMRRQFFVYSYPVEIDRCISCEGIWFDKEELEVLQYIYQKKEEYFQKGGF